MSRKQKTYILGMFPYPSGEGLHVGHVRIFTACDVMARYFRMKAVADPSTSSGSPRAQVLSPMGWDAFGLPAENAAIKAKKIPQEMVPHNYANFKKQMQALSLSFDWEHELATTDPTYYAFTQWLFLKLYQKGLVYRERVPINWCPKCKTGIANEEVLGDGTHERCGTATGKKLLPQWVMKITEYAERLLADLDVDLGIEGKKLESERKGLDWPKGILEMQRNWIGKKEGVVIHHKVKDMDMQLDSFSAFPAWLFADTYIVLAPEHPQVMDLVRGTEYEEGAKKFVRECSEITDQQRLEDKFEKRGYFTGRYALDPFNPGREMSVWIANFAMMGFGTGIIRCSSHDERDYTFAQKYKIETEFAEVVERINPTEPINAHDNEGVLVKSGPFTGREITPALIQEMKDWIVKEGIGRKEVTWHLRDWVFSRQRYWGEPIPLVYCEKCGDENGVVPLTEDQLPLTLPELDSYEPTDTGESPLSRVETWVTTTCPNCGGEARRETDTMPNWAGSCWYFLAYPWWRAESEHNNQAPSTNNQTNSNNQYVKSTAKILAEYKDKSKTPISDFWKEVAKPAIDQWLPADWYLGGAEHAVLHLLYARFWVKVFQDLGLVDFPEPFLRLRSVGMVLAEDGKKMSKSLGNVVNPDDMIAKYGSDATRMYEMFMGPWEQSIAWDSGAISGQVRFLERIKATAQMEGKVGQVSSPVLAAKLKTLVTRIEDGVLNQKFNTAIAGLMEFVNAWREEGVVISREHLGMFATLLSLFAPNTAEELQGQGKRDKVQVWPDVSTISGVEDALVKLAVQVNGKVRAILEVKGESAKVEEEVLRMALADERVNKWLRENPKKVIFVPGKLLSLVV